MPRKYKKRRRRKRRRYARISPPNNRLGFPANTTARFRYVTSIDLNPGATGLATHSFRANGCYDPDASGVGHQPRGWDQWAQFYNRYTVIGSKIKAYGVSEGGSLAVTPMAWGIYLNDNQTIPGTGLVQEMIEQGNTPYRIMSAASVGPSTGGRPLTKGFSAKKFFNITDVKDNNEPYGAPVSGDPTDQSYFTLWAGSIDPGATSDPPNMVVTIVIDYIVAFAEPKDLPAS